MLSNLFNVEEDGTVSGLDEQDLYKPKKEYLCPECDADVDEINWCFECNICTACCEAD